MGNKSDVAKIVITITPSREVIKKMQKAAGQKGQQSLVALFDQPEKGIVALVTSLLAESGTTVKIDEYDRGRKCPDSSAWMTINKK